MELGYDLNPLLPPMKTYSVVRATPDGNLVTDLVKGHGITVNEGCLMIQRVVDINDRNEMIVRPFRMYRQWEYVESEESTIVAPPNGLFQ
jgi:hypothetical protein